MIDTLNSAGPFTMFTPTDAGFAKLPAGTVDTLLKLEYKAALVKILTYHMVPGKVEAATVQGRATAKSGQTIHFPGE